MTETPRRRGRKPNPTPPEPRVSYKSIEEEYGWTRVVKMIYQWDRETKTTKYHSRKTIGYLPPGCDDRAQLVPKKVFLMACKEEKERLIREEQAKKEKAELEAKLAELAEKQALADIVNGDQPLIDFHDDRDPEKVIYPAYIVLIVLMMCLGSGYSSNRQIAEFWRARHKELKSFFPGLPDRFISHDTICNFVKAVGKCETSLLFEQFNAMLMLEAGVCEAISKNASDEERAAFQRSVLALDGQAIRASKISVGGERAKVCLAVFDTSCSVSLAQELVGKKTNEITHASPLIRRIDIKNSIITADAMHTQVEFLECVIEGEADYCMAVKSNQPSTRNALRKAFNDPKNEHLVKTVTQHDKGHGRYETRIIRVLPSSVLEPEIVEKWPGLENGSIAEVFSRRLVVSTDKKSEETRYFISSLKYDLDWIAPWLLSIVRRHWGIENKLHWVLDVTYGQDHVQCKNDDYLRGITTLNKLMYNFTSVAQIVLSKERGEKVSMQCLKPYFGSLTSFLPLLAMIWVGARGLSEGAENAKSTSIPAT